MEDAKLLKQIAEKVQVMSEKVGTLNGVAEKVEAISGKVDQISDDVAVLKEDTASTKETVNFLVENSASKEDLERFASKDDLKEVKDELLTHIDGLANQNRRFNDELVAMRATTDRHEREMQKITNHIELNV